MKEKNIQENETEGEIREITTKKSRRHPEKKPWKSLKIPQNPRNSLKNLKKNLPKIPNPVQPSKELLPPIQKPLRAAESSVAQKKRKENHIQFQTHTSNLIFFFFHFILKYRASTHILVHHCPLSEESRKMMTLNAFL